MEIDEDTRDRVERADQLRKNRQDCVGHITKGEQSPTSMSVLRGGKSIGAGYKHESPRHITKLQTEMQTQMMKFVAEDIDAAEIYSSSTTIAISQIEVNSQIEVPPRSLSLKITKITKNQ